MVNKDIIDMILNNSSSAIHIECSEEEAKELEWNINVNTKLILSYNEGLYGFFTIKEYLEFFKDINGTSVDITNIIDRFDLKHLSNTLIRDLDTSIKRKVLISRIFVSDASCIIINNPLKDVDNETAKFITSILEEISDSKKVITTSNSFRQVCLMSGSLYHFKKGQLVPIYESLKAITENDVKDTLVTKYKGIDYLISINDIYYAESIESVCHIFVENSLIPTQYTLNQLETKLENYNFFRSHRSYIVNLSKVVEIQQWTRNAYVLILDYNKELEIPLSKRRYNDLKSKLRSK